MLSSSCELDQHIGSYGAIIMLLERFFGGAYLPIENTLNGCCLNGGVGISTFAAVPAMKALQ